VLVGNWKEYMITTKKYIGISGVARSGKNSFADIMCDIYKERGISTKTFALAYQLKKDCEEFVQKNLGLSIWTEKTEEKNIFREFLVWYGDVKRKQSEGKYWTSKLKEDLDKSDANVNIITDIRYSIYPEDEVDWIKHVVNGKLIHIAKYVLKGNTKIFTEPANEHEIFNDPIVKRNADVSVEWESYSGSSYMAMLKDEKLRGIVKTVMEKL